MPYAPLLSESEIAEGLRGLPEWIRSGSVISRTVRLPTFRDAMAVVNAVADAAEAADHHPDIDIRWRRITFHLSTHAAGGLTAKDLAMAAQIDRLVATRWAGLESPGQ